MNTLEKISLDELIDLLMSVNDLGEGLMCDKDIHLIINEKIDAIEDEEEKEFYSHVISGLQSKIVTAFSQSEVDVKDRVISKLTDDIDEIDELVKRKLEIDDIFKQVTYDVLFDNNYYNKFNYILENIISSNNELGITKCHLQQKHEDKISLGINSSKCRFDNLFNIKLETIAFFEPVYCESKYIQFSFNNGFPIKPDRTIYDKQLYKSILFQDEIIKHINEQIQIRCYDNIYSNYISYLKIKKNRSIDYSNKKAIRKIFSLLRRTRNLIKHSYIPTNVVWFKLDNNTHNITDCNIYDIKDNLSTKITWFKLEERQYDDNAVYFKINKDGTVNSDEIAVFNVKTAVNTNVELRKSIEFNTLHYFVTEPDSQSLTDDYPDVIGYSEASTLSPSLCV